MFNITFASIDNNVEYHFIYIDLIFIKRINYYFLLLLFFEKYFSILPLYSSYLLNL